MSLYKTTRNTMEVKKAQKAEIWLHIISVFVNSVYCGFMSWEKDASLKKELSLVPLRDQTGTRKTLGNL